MEAELETKVVDQGSKTKGESAKVVDLLAVDRHIDRYELIHRLGHGGMATVYLGRTLGKAGFERLVAVKVIHPHLASEPEFVEMFLDEARIAAKIHHPHVVAIHDVGEDDGVFYMVMEYVEGDTLASLQRQLQKDERRLPLSAVLQIAADACEGLAAAHDAVDADGKPLRLVHRDVSPHNLLVGADGRVKVVDFGIMKAVGKRSSTLTGQLRGKIAYMSPEQARGKSIDHRTDLFALGAVLWELTTGERLFTGDNESAILTRVLECEVPDPQSLRADLPDGVADVIRKALSRDREDRYESAQDMLRDIRTQLRRLDPEIDPRQDLSAEMERYFTRRIEYIRAAVRRRAGSEPRPLRPSDRELMAGVGSEPGRRIGDDDLTKTPHLSGESGPREKTAPLAAVDSAVAAESAPARTQTQTHTNTATTGLASAPARHWGLWLLLPLVGAAIAIIVLQQRPSADESEAPSKRAPVDTAPTPASTTPGPTPRADASAAKAGAAATVKWHINTSPEGAIVTIDDRRYDDPTPMSVELPRSEDPVAVVIEIDGYRPQRARLAPARTENFTYTLEPETKQVKIDHTLETRFHPSKQKTKKKAAPVPDTEDTAGSDSKKGDFDEVPDWMKSKDAKSP